eukprot:gnl/Dysnectes_brevis/1375_a1546_1857.p1 GENE.gnl/Dysnectes_brevis/1375_a1546_1857~~gnl/Dysnectes_brevis/1375_a1546_1857.p1  ORF type:complete len:476 (+),score=66.66 gnl/Dysnectes_brevis/1375_a1546_1857:32-1459(+)
MHHTYSLWEDITTNLYTPILVSIASSLTVNMLRTFHMLTFLSTTSSWFFLWTSVALVSQITQFNVAVITTISLFVMCFILSLLVDIEKQHSEGSHELDEKDEGSSDLTMSEEEDVSESVETVKTVSDINQTSDVQYPHNPRRTKRPRHPLPSISRATTIAMTIHAIRAVDTSSYPSLHHKRVDITGVGLMDTGVGMFILTTALTEAVTGRKPGSKIVQKATKNLLFGIARLMILLVLQYETDPGEYGRHWNFFFSLFTVDLLRVIAGEHGEKPLAVFMLVLSASRSLLGMSPHFVGLEGIPLVKDNLKGIVSAFNGLFPLAVLGPHIIRRLLRGRMRYRVATLSVVLASASMWFVFPGIHSRECDFGYVMTVFFILLASVSLHMFALPLPRLYQMGFGLSALDHTANLAFLCANVLTGSLRIIGEKLAWEWKESNPFIYDVVTHMLYFLMISLICGQQFLNSKFFDGLDSYFLVH